MLEMSRALRLQAGLPLTFWGDCVLTSVYLINRLPCRAIQHMTPYEKLFHKQPSYLNLKTFGCLAFAINPSRDKDKFLPRGVPCLFLGYPSNQKGYKLLNLTNQQLFISSDVKFVENVFPYNISTNSSSYLKPLPTPMPETSTTLIYSDCDLPTDTNIENEPIETPQNPPTSPEPQYPEPTSPQLTPDPILPSNNQSFNPHSFLGGPV